MAPVHPGVPWPGTEADTAIPGQGEQLPGEQGEGEQGQQEQLTNQDA